MPIPELLVCRNRGGNVGGYELANGSVLTQFGSDIAGVVPTLLGDDSFGPGETEIIEFKGSMYLVTQTTTIDPDVRIYKFSGGSWSQVFSTGVLSGMNDARNRSGLFIYNNGSDVRLGVMVMNGSGSTRLIDSEDGSTWNNTVINHSSISFRQGKWLLHKNDMWYCEISTPNWVQFDLVGLTATSYDPPWDGGATIPFEQDDRLYAIALEDLGTDMEIYKFTGAGFAKVGDVTTDNRFTLTARNAMLHGWGMAVVIGADVHVFTPCLGTGGTSDYGSLYFHLERTAPDTWTVTENETVIPAGLRPGARGTSSNNAEDRWVAFVDTETDPANPEIYLFVLEGGAPGTAWAIYKFVDTSTEMTFQTASVANDYVMPVNRQGGSQSVSRGSGNRAEVIDTQGVSAGTEVSYRVYGTNLAQTVKAYITDASGVPSTQAVLTGAATGGSSTRSGNEIQNVDGDDGATLYTFIIDNIGSGLAAAERFYVKLDIQ